MNSQSYFAVKYSYYQYNDGSANNGDRTGEKRVASAQAAIDLAATINAAAARHKGLMAVVDGQSMTDDVSEETEWADRDLVNDLIQGGCGGYFYSAEAQFVTVTRKPLVATGAA